MLLLDSEIEVNGLTIFRDHVSPRTFHYLPGPPRVVTLDSGKAGLQLLRYRGGREGGFLTLDVDLTLDEEALAAAREELGSRAGGGEAELVPVLFHEGTVRLTALDFQGSAGEAPGAGMAGTVGMVERVLGTAVPSLLGRARAIFALELDREGASLIEKAIGPEGTPLAVVYDLAFTGLRPARGLRARVRHGMAYDFLRTRVAANTLFFKADLDRESEALAREGHIEIEDVDYQGSDPEILARRQEEVRATLHELSRSLFFRPATSPDALRPAPAGTPGGARVRPQAAFVLRALEQREEQELVYDLRETAAATARVAPQGMLRLPSGADPAELVLDVTFEGPAVTEVRAFTLPGADWEGVEAIEVEVRCGGESRALVLSPETPDGAALLPPPSAAAPLEHRVRVLTRDEPEALGSPPEPDPAFHPLETRHLALDPAALARRRVLRVVLGAIDPAAVRQARVRLHLGDQSRELLLDAAERAEARVPVRGDAPLRLDAELITAAGGVIDVSQEVPSSQTVVVVNQPADRFQTVLVTFQDPLERWDSVHVELERAPGEARRVLTLSAAEPSGRWSAERPAGAPRTFRYHARQVGRDGTLRDGGWKEAAGSLLLVGDPDIRVENVQVIPLGPPDLMAVQLRLVSLEPPPGIEPAVEALLEPGQPPFQARLPFRRGAARRYRVEGQVFLADGERQIDPREETAEVLLLQLG